MDRGRVKLVRESFLIPIGFFGFDLSLFSQPPIACPLIICVLITLRPRPFARTASDPRANCFANSRSWPFLHCIIRRWHTALPGTTGRRNLIQQVMGLCSA
jgi:hypothetical protein